MSEVFSIISMYKKMKGYDSIENWDKIYGRRWLKPASNMLKLTPIGVVERYLATFENAKFYWDLWTVERGLPDWLVKNQSLINTAEIRIDEMLKCVVTGQPPDDITCW